MGNKNQSSSMFRIWTGLESCTLMLAFKCTQVCWTQGRQSDNMSKNCYHRLLGQFSSPITAWPQETQQFSKENMALELHQNHEPFNHFDDFNNVRLLQVRKIWDMLNEKQTKTKAKERPVLTKGHRSYWTRSASRLC